MNEDDDQQNLFDDVSPDYIQRPEDPYPILQSAQSSSTIKQHEDVNTIHTLEIADEPQQMQTDEMDFYIKSMPAYKHQAYLIGDILQSVSNKLLLAQKEFEERFISFIREQRQNDQEHNERIYREQREHQLELVQLIINQGRQ